MIYRLHNEDCFKTMENLYGQVNMVLTSPPYNMTYRKGGPSDTGRYDVYVDWKSEEEYLNWTVDLYKSFYNILKDDGVIAYNFSYSIENPSLPYKLVNAIIDNTEFVLVDTIIWKKSNGMPFPANKYRLSRNWEFVFIFVKRSNINNFNINREVTKVSPNGQKYYKVEYNFINAPNNNEVCPLNRATYSVELCEQLLNLYAPKNGIVYDPFSGTGTTLVACHNLDINFIGSEISKQQCEWASKRILSKI